MAREQIGDSGSEKGREQGSCGRDLWAAAVRLAKREGRQGGAWWPEKEGEKETGVKAIVWSTE